MNRSFTGAQIVLILEQAGAGEPVKDLYRPRLAVGAARRHRSRVPGKAFIQRAKPRPASTAGNAPEVLLPNSVLEGS